MLDIMKSVLHEQVQFQIGELFWPENVNQELTSAIDTALSEIRNTTGVSGNLMARIELF